MGGDALTVSELRTPATNGVAGGRKQRREQTHTAE